MYKQNTMNKYNEVPHEKINSEKTNEMLRNMVEYGHKKERQIVDNLLAQESPDNFVKSIDFLTECLSSKSESELSHVLNVIVRETHLKKQKSSDKK